MRSEGVLPSTWAAAVPLSDACAGRGYRDHGRAAPPTSFTHPRTSAVPFPSPPRALAGPRRRSLLASAAGAALLVGCSTGSDDSGGTGQAPSAAERMRARAAR
ncbi:hypothetical protein ACWDAO_41305, partial [Streptomyces sp. NPDC001212]